MLLRNGHFLKSIWMVNAQQVWCGVGPLKRSTTWVKDNDIFFQADRAWCCELKLALRDRFNRLDRTVFYIRKNKTGYGEGDPDGSPYCQYELVQSVIHKASGRAEIVNRSQ